MPSLMKLVATTVPRADRGRMIGALNAIPNVAAVLTPVLAGLLLPWIGWKALVVGLGVAGLLLALVWRVGMPAAAQGTGRAPAPVAQPRSGLPSSGTRPMAIRRFIAVFSLCKVLSDATWWLLLYWLPDILHVHFALGLRGLGLASGGVYLAAGLGSVCGGLLPALWPTHTRSREKTRRAVMGAAALCVVPMMFVYASHTVMAGVGLLMLALMAHQVFSTNLFGLVTEWAPTALVGRIMGIGAFCGNLGGAVVLWLTGFVPMPLILGLCSLAYLAAWAALGLWLAPPWLEQAFPPLEEETRDPCTYSPAEGPLATSPGRSPRIASGPA